MQLSVGRGPVASRNQRCVLLRDVGVCPGRRGSVEGQASQIGDGGQRTSTPTVVAALTPGHHGMHLQGAGAFGPIGHMAWGTICALLCLGCGRVLLWWLLGRGVHWSQSLCRALLRDVRAVAASRGWWRWQSPTGVSGCWWRVLCDRVGWGLCGWLHCWPLHCTKPSNRVGDK